MSMVRTPIIYIELVSHEIFGPGHDNITRLRSVEVCRRVSDPRLTQTTRTYYAPTPSSMRRTRQVMNKAEWMVR
jgi:hypothetical protein